MKQHPHVATPYEIKAAAEQRLKAIVLPLLPEPKLWGLSDLGLTKRRWWVLDEERELAFSEDMSGEEIVKRLNQYGLLPYAEGDRIYLQEQWWDDRVTDDPSEVVQYHLKSGDPHLTHGWEPASTMPPEAAQHWFAINEVKVCQCKDLGFKTMAKTGIYFDCPGIDYPGREAKAVWDYNYPEQPWQYDRWVIVLQVEAIAQ